MRYIIRHLGSFATVGSEERVNQIAQVKQLQDRLSLSRSLLSPGLWYSPKSDFK